MLKKKLSKLKTPSLKKQIVGIALGVVKIQESLVATNTEIAEINQRLVRIEGRLDVSEARLNNVESQMATKTDLFRVESSLSKDIHDLNEGILQSFMKIHEKTHDKIEDRLQKLETSASSN